MFDDVLSWLLLKIYLLGDNDSSSEAHQDPACTVSRALPLAVVRQVRPPVSPPCCPEIESWFLLLGPWASLAYEPQSCEMIARFDFEQKSESKTVVSHRQSCFKHFAAVSFRLRRAGRAATV